MWKILLKALSILSLIMNINGLEKNYNIKPLEKVCEGIDAEKGEILTFYIRGLEGGPVVRVFFQENRKITKIINNDYNEKELIYESLRGGVVELCVKSLEDEKNYDIEIDCYRGLYAFNKENDFDIKDLSKAVDKSNSFIKELIDGFNDVINQEEMNYIVKKTFYEKVLDSIRGKN